MMPHFVLVRSWIDRGRYGSGAEWMKEFRAETRAAALAKARRWIDRSIGHVPRAERRIMDVTGSTTVYDLITKA